METANLDSAGSFPEGFDRMATPAFVYDERAIHRLLDYAAPLREEGRCQLLFAIKSFSFAAALRVMAPRLDGFAVSSLFEARLARSIVGDGTGDGTGARAGERASVHLTTPGFREDEADEISSLCDYVSFNSLNHWDRYSGRMKGRAAVPRTSTGLRVNPQLSFARNQVHGRRYDPCRPQSKLGTPLDDLAAVLRDDPARLDGIRGILFHSNCDSPDFGELRATVERLQSRAAGLLRRVEWVNLGGGYLFENDDENDGENDRENDGENRGEERPNFDELRGAIDSLRSQFGVQVFLEPGSGLIRAAGYFVATVLDLFQSGGASVAVLDTSVNHMPEVFEYGFQPDVVGAVNVEDSAENGDAPYEYLLAGCTCLAGDLFGSYRFPERLSVGDKVVFSNAGSYTLTKANMFNGVALPSVYALDTRGELTLQSSPAFAEYAARWGLSLATP